MKVAPGHASVPSHYDNFAGKKVTDLGRRRVPSAVLRCGLPAAISRGHEREWMRQRAIILPSLIRRYRPYRADEPTCQFACLPSCLTFVTDPLDSRSESSVSTLPPLPNSIRLTDSESRRFSGFRGTDRDAPCGTR